MSDVLIVCKDEDSAAAVSGVLVRIYDSGGSLETSGTTGEGSNEAGERLFDLAVGDYTMRLSMSTGGYSIKSPQSFTVTGTPAEDIFDVSVNQYTRPNAEDARLCRCSGYFHDADGTPLRNASIYLHLVGHPLVVGADAFYGEKATVKTDSKGYASIDLIRGGVYRSVTEHLIDLSIETRIPDAASANLVDVLFPVVESIEFVPSSTSIVAGQKETIASTVVYRSGLRVPVQDFCGMPITIKSSDREVATTSVTSDGLVVTGLKEGSVSVTAARTNEDMLFRFSPKPATVSGSLSVTIT